MNWDDPREEVEKLWRDLRERADFQQMSDQQVMDFARLGVYLGLDAESLVRCCLYAGYSSLYSLSPETSLLIRATSGRRLERMPAPDDLPF